MADFINQFWSWYITIPVLLGLVFCVLLIRANTIARSVDEEGDAEPVGHVWDGDLEELNTPMPKWWLNMFYITLVFGLVYLLLYPGLGSFDGFLGWSSKARYESEVADAEAAYAPLYASYLATPVNELAQNNEAMGTARRLYSTNCAICHGADARGAIGFPNLADDDWQWGEDETTIKTTLINGRVAAMPGWEAALGQQGIEQVAEYVYSLTRDPVNPSLVAPGKEKYTAMCVACHGAEGQGNPALGAPNLADDVWLYGGSLTTIRESLKKGRAGVMPAFGDKLTESQIHLLTAYLGSLK